MRAVINIICVILGFIFAGIGLLGVVLPILPATPFFLAGAFLFAKGSKKFHVWFLNTKLYRKYIDQAVNKKEMTIQAKRKMLVTLGILFILGFCIAPIWHARLLIGIIAAGHLYYVLFKIRTVKTENQIAAEEV